VFVTTAMTCSTPRINYRRWRHDWAEINRPVEEIDQLVNLPARPR
jgi:hypothetical protein